MFSRMDHLYSSHLTMSKDELRRKLIQWDSDQGRAMAASERKLTKPPKKFDWSPALRNAAIIRRYWILRLRESTASKNYANTFRNWQERIQRQDPSFSFPLINQSLDTPTIRKHLNCATRNFRKCQVSSLDLRIKSYEELLDTYTQDDGFGISEESQRKAKIVRRTIQTESCRGLYHHLRQELNPGSFSQLSKILVPRNKNSVEATPPGTSIHSILNANDQSDIVWDTVLDKATLSVISNLQQRGV
ncbi:hypothetical protein MHU86_11265 [Fragilaria crotonensis]|nr:hypothetical protein MHU86_11265 [Fragilaria crotonensis]